MRLLVGRFCLASKIASGINSGDSITSEAFRYQSWQMNYCVEPRKRIGRLAKCKLLRRKFSIHHGFKRPSMRHGVLMRQILSSGAWNADVWLQLFLISLSDCGFDSDRNCVCVCVCACVWVCVGVLAVKRVCLKQCT